MNLPFHKQSHDLTCGPAVLQMVFEYYGVYESQEKLAEILKPTETHGTSHAVLLSTARKYGFRCHTRIRSSAKDIKDFLAKNIPVIVNYNDPSSEDGHYAIIVGANDTEFIMNDPENGKGFRINIGEFEKRWHNITGRSIGWLMTMSPKSPIKKRVKS